MNYLRPPSDLQKVDFFVVLWDRDDRRFILMLRNNESYELADGPIARTSMVNALDGDEELAERCLDAAQNFVASVCYPSLRDVLPIPEKFVKSKTATEVMFEAKNIRPWEEILSPSNVLGF